MPITSTKNARLWSGFGVSNSMWPRWARSNIGSGCIRISPYGSAQRSCQIVEQFVRGIGAGNEPLLGGILADHLQRTADVVAVKVQRRALGGRRQYPMHFAHDIWMI